MNKKIALIGNPNCGKTTLYNALTGKYQKTGNWTGVTTEKRSAPYKNDDDIIITDLPGVYSLNAWSLDERVVTTYIKDSPPDVFINVLDGTNLERNLFLTLELCLINVPIVLAINFSDELEKNNILLNEKRLSELLGVPVIKISALKNDGIEQLIDSAKTVQKKPKPLQNANTTARERYEFIEKMIEQVVIKKQTRCEIFTQKADKLLLNKVFALPIFFIVMTIVYFLSIKMGGVLGNILLNGLSQMENSTRNFLIEHGVPNFLISLSCDAILKGVATVCSFLPQILILFALLTLIEQFGYASRIAFILDRIFRTFGLSGKSIIPMIVSSGCAVSGLMSTRTISETSERRMTVFLSPFIPCGAKTAVFGWFSCTFFNGSALIATSMYFLAILCTAVFGWILKKLKVFKCNDGTFILEMPLLRKPSVKDLFFVMKEKTTDFITKAGTIIFLISIALWFLQNFGISGYTNGNVQKSFLFAIGNAIKFIYYPLGFSNWQTSVALISGAFAKEAVVETLILTASDFQTLFNNAFSVYAFMAFVLLSPPCIASLATARTELNSNKWFIAMLVFQFASAYVVALAINCLGILFTGNFGLLLSAFVVIMILIITIECVKKLKHTKCKLCGLCKKGAKKCQSSKKRYTT